MTSIRRTLAASVLAAGILWGGAAFAECKVGVLAELPVRIVDGQPRVTIQINGHDADALIATGSQQSAVRSWAAQKLGVHGYNVSAEFEMKRTNIPARAAEIETVQLDKLMLKRVPIFVSGSDHRERGDEDVVLGANFFSEADVEFDLPHGKMRVLKPVGCKDDEVLYWGGAYSMAPIRLAAEGQFEPRIEVKINGKSYEALLATESFNSYVTNSVAQAVGSRPAPGAISEWELLSRRPRSFDSFAVDQETLKNVVIDVVTVKQVFDQAPTGRYLAARVEVEPVTLGADFMKAHRVLLSNSQHRVYMTYESGRVFEVSTAADVPTKRGT